MAEVESIKNSRPLLTAETMSDISSMALICPNNILTVKTSMLVPPPGVFTWSDLYNRCHWKGSQHLGEEFWSRWKKDFLISLQERNK